MATIIINSKGTTLSVDRNCFTLRASGKKVARIPAMMIDQFVIDADVEVTRKALGRLGRSGIPTVFLDYAGRVQTRMISGWTSDGGGRLTMAKWYFEKRCALKLAKKWVRAKLCNQAAVLRASERNYPNAQVRNARMLILKFERKAEFAKDVEQLMGMEGMGAKAYFSVFGHLLRGSWPWHGIWLLILRRH